MISGIVGRLAQVIGIHRRVAFALLGISLLILVLAMFGDQARATFRYERVGLTEFELWRVLTAHIVHLGWAHALMNLAALWLIAWLFGGLLSAGHWLVLGLAAALGISAGLWWFSPEIDWYVGLSGILHGYALAAGIVLVAHRVPAGYLVLFMVVGKVLWEQATGALPMTELTSGGAVIIDSHLYGAIAGAVVGIIAARKERVA